LALFGRRLSEREDGLGIPASENLHNADQRQNGCDVGFLRKTQHRLPHP
jgi:hypothetical protein